MREKRELEDGTTRCLIIRPFEGWVNLTDLVPLEAPAAPAPAAPASDVEAPAAPASDNDDDDSELEPAPV